MCHSEERSDVGISCNRLRFCRGSLVIQHGTARLPRAQSALAMTHQGNALVHQRPPAVELSCTRRSLSAATPHILAFTVLSLTCTDRQHSAGSGMPLPYNGVCDQRECLPEIATGAKRPRNDTSGGAVVHQRPPAIEWLCTRRSLSAATPHILAFTVLSLTCTDRQHSAGSGMPLPYNGVCDQRECLPEIATSAYGLLAMTNLRRSPFC